MKSKENYAGCPLFLLHFNILNGTFVFLGCWGASQGEAWQIE